MNKADQNRRFRSPEFKIKTEKRFQGVSSSLVTPGPEYSPGPRLDRPKQPQYSFGKPPPGRKKGRNMELATSTPFNVGPNSYFKEGYPDHIVKKKDPVFKIGSELRSKWLVNKTAVNETYED